jgi:predicted flap endonuclease-1-like 5' DNA nuclease/predicted  nucleic acid-binding Zn-ribbon protein
MIYLLGEIFVCVLVAGLLGLVVGWLLKQWLVGDLENEWRGRLGEAEERSLQQQQEARTKIRALHDDLEARAVDITRLEGEREAAAVRHESEREGLSSSIEDLRKALDAASAGHAELASERDGLRAASAELAQKLEASSARITEVEGSSAALQKDLEAARARAADLEKERDGLASTVAELGQELESTRAGVAAAEGERDQLHTSVDRMRTDLESANTLAAGLRAERDEVDGARAELERAMSARGARIAELEQALADARSKAESIEGGWQQRWDRQAARLASVESAATAASEATAKAQSEKDEVAAQLARCERRRVELEGTVGKLERGLENERARVATAVADVRRFGRESRDRGQTAAAGSARKKPSAAAGTSAVRGTYGAYVSNRDGQHYFRFMRADGSAVLRSEGYTTRAACENGIRSVLKNGAREGGIKSEVARNGQPFFRIVATNGQVVGMSRMFKNRAEVEEAISLFASGTAWERVEIEAPKAAAAKPAIAKKTARTERDDLKKIHGIGPVLERLLNRHGVSRFADIAAWTKRDIERFAAKLDTFPGRIVRDDWVGGAKRQHAAKYDKK